MMLANPIEDKDFINLNYNDFVAEWKWDGIRVQIIINDFNIKIFSRTGDDISLSFPEIKSLEKNMVILDGELLVGKNHIPMNFNSLQQRLNRKKVSKNKTAVLFSNQTVMQCSRVNSRVQGFRSFASGFLLRLGCLM